MEANSGGDDNGQDSRIQDTENQSEGLEQGATATRGRFPTTVSIKQDSDKAYLILSFRGLEVSSGFFGLGSGLKNGEILNEDQVFKSSEIHLKVQVTTEDGSQILYEYKKSLPKKIASAKSLISYEEKNKIKLALKKVDKKADWTIYTEHFQHPDSP